MYSCVYIKTFYFTVYGRFCDMKRYTSNLCFFLHHAWEGEPFFKKIRTCLHLQHRRISFDENWFNNRGLTTITACVLCHQLCHYSDVIMIRFQCLQTKKKLLSYTHFEIIQKSWLLLLLFFHSFTSPSPKFLPRSKYGKHNAFNKLMLWDPFLFHNFFHCVLVKE